MVDRNQLAYRIHWRCKRPRISSRASDQNISGVVRRPFAVFSLAQVGTVWIKPGVKGGEIRGDTGTGYETPKLCEPITQFSNQPQPPFTPPPEKSSPLFSWACTASTAPSRSRPRYSEIEKVLLARREAAVSGRRPVPNRGPSLQGAI